MPVIFHTALDYYISIIEDLVVYHIFELTLLWSYYNHAIRQAANLFNSVILCVEINATMFVLITLYT